MIINKSDKILDAYTFHQSWQTMRNDGYVACTGYVTVSHQPKELTPNAKAIADAIVYPVIPNYEDAANRPLGGRAAGIADGNYATNRLKQLNYSPTQTIIISYDFDMINYLANCVEYGNGFIDTLEADGFYGGTYGPYPIINALANRSHINWHDASTYFDHHQNPTTPIHLQQQLQQVYNNTADVNICITPFDTVYGDLKYAPKTTTKGIEYMGPLAITVNGALFGLDNYGLHPLHNGNDVSLWTQANPTYKSITLSDTDMARYQTWYPTNG